MKRTTMYWIFFLVFLTGFFVEINPQNQVSKILASDYNTESIPNEYIVVINTKKLKTDSVSYLKIKESTARELTDYLLQNVPHEAEFLNNRSLIFPNYVVLQVTLEPQYVHLLQQHPLVTFMEANHKINLYNSAPNITNNVTLNDRTCLLQETGKSLWGLSRISSRDKVDRVSEYMYVESDGEGVDIYVLDTGIKTDHQDFGGRAVHGFAAPRIRFNEGSDDLHGHGTHIAATAGGSVHGVAKQANLISVKSLDRNGVGYSGDIVDGLEWIYTDIEQKQAAKGRRAKSVINMSLGSERDHIQTSIEVVMLDIASEFGVTFVTAAGNANDDACYYSPARLSWTITVGSTDESDTKSDFSNKGPCVDIFAPGGDILSAALGSTEDTVKYSGTSMATPHVSGVIARYLSRLCEMPPPASVKAWLLNLATTDAINMHIDVNTPNKLLYMPCFWDGATVEAGSIMIQENDFRYDIILFTLILGMGVLLLVSVFAVALSFATYKSTRKNQPVSDLPFGKSNSRKYQVSGNVNSGFIGDDDEENRVTTPNPDYDMDPEGCYNTLNEVQQDVNDTDINTHM